MVLSNRAEAFKDNMLNAAQFPEEQSTAGEFQRQEDSFRDWISESPASVYRPTSGRYHLYISLACPWASRTFIVLRLKKLEQAIGVTVVDPIRDEHGWAFREGPGYSRDPINGFHFLSEAYAKTDPAFDGRVTVPVLWDRQRERIVNNSEDDICRMFNDVFPGIADDSVDLFPEEIAAEQTKLSQLVYDRVNNGVYKAGFATSQRPYERAVHSLFATLDQLEERLAPSRYLFGKRIVETDWRLFCTLIRFDAVYHGHFKCHFRRIVDYPNLDGYLRDLYHSPALPRR